jgi:hypothetical protein
MSEPSPAPAVAAIDASLDFPSTEAYAEFVGQFIAGTLPKPRWTHRAHLVTGLWHLLHHSPEESLKLLRERIRAYNVAVGGVNTDTAGYHETLTQFYVTGIHQWLVEHTALRTNPPGLARRLLTSRFADKNFPLEFYSKELLFSVEARRDGVSPDLVTKALVGNPKPVR